MVESSRSTKANGHPIGGRKSRKHELPQQVQAASARWDGIRQTEDDVIAYFKEHPLKTCLETFAVMRKHYELAGKIIDGRVQEENVERCVVCGIPFSESKPWYNRSPVKDPVTSIVTNVFTCSQACMIESKRATARKF